MAVRRKPRTKMVAPLRMWGTDSTGKPFNVLAYTLNVSSNGARIGGVKAQLAVGDAITIQYKQNRALFKVVWLGRPGDKTHEQIGVTLLEQDRPIWGEIDDPENYQDDFKGKRKEVQQEETPLHASPATEAQTAEPQPAPAASAPEPTASSNNAEQAGAVSDVLPSFSEDDASIDTNGLLRACAEGLLKLDAYVKKRPPDPPVLQEFRDALAKVRQSVWALQQWYENKAEGHKAFPLLSYLNTERVRFITQATHDLADDIEQKAVEIDSALLQKLFARFDRLRSVLGGAFDFEVVPPDTEAKPVASAVEEGLRSVMTDALHSGMAESDAMGFIARELQRTVGADGVAIARLEAGEMVCVGSSGNAPEVGMVLETETGIGGEAIGTGQLVYCRDTQSDPRVDAELCLAAQIGAVAMVPIFSSSNQPVGMVQISTARPNPFTDEHLSALRTTSSLLREAIGASRTVGPA